MTWLFLLGFFALTLWAYARFALSGEDLGHLDLPRDPPVNAGHPASEQLQHALAELRDLQRPSQGRSRREQLAASREAMDAFGAEIDTSALHIVDVSAAGVAAEWLTTAQSDPDQRLLYLHGGAFALGSPRSHRRITAELARRLKMSVLAIDYRLMPEHQRLDGLTDCQSAYRWILEHGPEGVAPCKTLLVAGDSAGGNLTLALVAWARDNQLRRADAAIALSPATDGTFASPSLRRNIATDVMLGPSLGPMLKFPSAVLLWGAWLAGRVKPTDPRISPLRGELHDLPPTLVMASECEMLLDDACRYAHKARQAGSLISLQTWNHMMHVWQIFVPELPEADQAFHAIAAFASQHTAPNPQNKEAAA